jgi:hypothetical protein
MVPILGFDFSAKKPAACLYLDNQYTFFSWPSGLKNNLKENFRSAGIHLIDRDETEYPVKDVSDKMRVDLKKSLELSELIINTIKPYVDLKECNIAFEGFSFASSGNVVIQLAAYRFVLLSELYRNGCGIDRIFTYSPITIKKIAGCPERKKKKEDIINSFMESSFDIPFKNYVLNNKSSFQKRTGSWIDHMDDLVDAFWVVETFKSKYY